MVPNKLKIEPPTAVFEESDDNTTPLIPATQLFDISAVTGYLHTIEEIPSPDEDFTSLMTAARRERAFTEGSLEEKGEKRFKLLRWNSNVILEPLDN